MYANMYALNRRAGVFLPVCVNPITVCFIRVVAALPEAILSCTMCLSLPFTLVASTVKRAKCLSERLGMTSERFVIRFKQHRGGDFAIWMVCVAHPIAPLTARFESL